MFSLHLFTSVYICLHVLTSLHPPTRPHQLTKFLFLFTVLKQSVYFVGICSVRSISVFCLCFVMSIIFSPFCFRLLHSLHILSLAAYFFSRLFSPSVALLSLCVCLSLDLSLSPFLSCLRSISLGFARSLSSAFSLPLPVVLSHSLLLLSSSIMSVASLSEFSSYSTHYPLSSICFVFVLFYARSRSRSLALSFFVSNYILSCHCHTDRCVVPILRNKTHFSSFPAVYACSLSLTPRFVLLIS